MSLLVRYIGAALPLPEIAFFRSLIPTIIIGLLIINSGKPFFPRPRRPLILRGLLGTGGLFCFFHATQHLPLSISGILIWCTPLVTFVAARLFLNEKLALKTMLWLGVTLTGLLTIMSPAWLTMGNQPASVNFQLVDLLIGLIGTTFVGMVFVTIRSASASHNNNSIVLALSVTATLISGGLMTFNFQPPSPHLWLALIGAGLTGTMAQLSLTEAYRNAPAALVSSMSLMQAPFSIVWGMLIFSESISITHFSGISLMGLGVLMAVLSHSRSKAKQNNRSP